MKQLKRLRPSSGLSFDVAPWEVPDQFYTRLRNIIMRNGAAHRFGSQRVAYDPPSVPPYHLLNVPVGETNFWLYCGDENVYVVEGSNHDDVTPSGGLSTILRPSQWTSTLLNGLAVVNNSLDAPHAWDGNPANELTELDDWPANTLAEFIVAFRYHLFAGGISVSGTLDPTLLLWSDAAEPGALPDSWTPAADNEAGFTSLADTPGRLIGGRKLRDQLIIYKRASAFTVNYVGGNEKFAVKGLWEKNGALTNRAFDGDAKHRVVTEGDIVVNDGFSEPVSIADKTVRKFLFSQLDSTNFEALQVLFNPRTRETWILFPETGEDFCTLALVQSTDGWGVVELEDVAHAAMGIVDDTQPGETWDDDELVEWDDDELPWSDSTLGQSVQSMVVASPTNETLTLLESGDLTVRESLIAKYSMTFGEPERLKYIRRVHIRGRDFGSLTVRIGTQMLPDEAITWRSSQTISNPDQPVPGDEAIGRYISIEVSGTDTSEYEITGFDFEYELKGYF